MNHRDARLDPASYTGDSPFYSALECFRLLGPSARTCFNNLTRKSDPITNRDEAVLLDFGFPPVLKALVQAPQLLVTMLDAGDVPNSVQSATFDRVFSAKPLEGLPRPSNHLAFAYTIPTPLLRRAVVAVIRKQDLDKTLELARVFGSQPTLFGYFFEARALESIQSSGITIHFRTL